MHKAKNEIILQKFIVISATVLLLLTPTINIPAPLVIKSLDVYGAALFIIISGIVILQRMRVSANLIFVISVFFVLLIQMTFLEIIYRNNDYTGISLASRSILTVIVAYGCAQSLIKIYDKYSISVFTRIIIFCAFLQGSIFWLSFFFPSIRELMSALFFRDFGRGADHLILLRVPGFVSTGGDGLSMNHALLCVVGLVGTYITFPAGRFRQSIIIALFISMAGTAVTGRSGLYLGTSFMVTLMLIQVRGSFDVRKMYRILICFLLLFVVINLFSNDLGDFGKDLLDKHGYEHPIVRLLRGFIDMRVSGSYSNSTILTLLTDMVILPSEVFHFLLGNNYYNSMIGSYISTDVGYFRMWHGIGFIGLFVFLGGVFFVPVLRVRVSMKNLLSKTSNLTDRRTIRALGQLLLVILFFGLIGHYKIFYLSTRIYLFVFFTFFFLILHYYKSADVTMPVKK